MIIKQKYAGWIGIKLNGFCANKDMCFKITNYDMDNQLCEHEPTISEIQGLVNGISKQEFKGKKEMLGYLNKIGCEMVDCKIDEMMVIL